MPGAAMTERAFYDGLLWTMFVLGPITFLSLQFISAPYGRHTRAGWGPQIDGTLAWLLMESPAPLAFAAFYLAGERRFSTVPLCFFALWELHYLHRAFIFPFRRRGGHKPMPLAVTAMAIVFNLANAYLNGRWLTHFAPPYDATWLAQPQFLVGAVLFLGGFAVNFQSDSILFNLRKPGETGYRVPQGGLYRWLSCPNYFGEIVEWSGWAIATWSLPGLAFAVWTIANLAPRARSNHRWYREQFPDYPRERKALLPGLF